ncbi:TolC family protein [Ancylomarina sp. 16SWW S1-10-2]|uniref:TolC family protein n=1 Tax=Ancylomarina sp. 16SWW S1-10-2 TaxID=2499681 RepID=UPI0012ADFB67|nr:TolC family protein [Ancylomarina sp. 16SWW S1-10-2]MRT92984.1 TolC family protein [Ancylomarina sp. 16SWW S1-10-2]
MNKYISIILMLFCAGTLSAQKELSLAQAIEVGLEKNYNIQIVRQSEKIADLNNTWGNAGQYPKVEFNFSSANKKDYNESDDYRQNILSPSLDLTWTLFDGFAVRIRKDKFNDLAALSKGNTIVAVESQIELIILAYYKTLMEQERLNVSKKIMELSEDRFSNEKVASDIGTTGSYELLLAKNAFLEDKSNYLTQQVNYNNTVRDLNFLLGVKESTQYIFTDVFMTPVTDFRLADLLDKMFANNNNLKNRYMQETIQKRDIEMARSNYYPSVSLGAGAEGYRLNQKYDVASKVDSKSHALYANLSLNYLIFNGNANRRALQIAKIEEEISKIETADLKHSLTNTLAQNFELYELRKELFDLAEENLSATEINMQLSKEKYESGSINSFNYRDVQISYQNASLARLAAIFNLIQSKTSLVRMTGGILSEF